MPFEWNPAWHKTLRQRHHDIQCSYILIAAVKLFYKTFFKKKNSNETIPISEFLKLKVASIK